MSQPDARSERPLVLAGVRPMNARGEFDQPSDVVVRDGRIAAIGTATAEPGVADAEVLDLQGAALVPGFIDCHVHVTHPGPDIVRGLHRPFSYQFFEAAVHLRTLLRTGITTIRDAGGADLGVARAVADGLTPGPHLEIAVQILSQTGGHTDGWCVSGNVVERIGLEHPGRPHGVIDGVAEVRKKVRELKRAGATWIKVCSSGGVISVADDPMHPHFRLDELRECVEEAATSGTPVMAHAAATEGIKNAVRAGVRSIEHGIYLDDEAVELMLDRGTWLVPTLSAPRALVAMADAGGAVAPQVAAKARAVLDVHETSFRRAVEAGVPIAMGTDTGVGPHGSNLEELDHMVQAGMGVADALLSATTRAAELLGLADDRGSIEVGKRADLVVLDAPPRDLRSLRDRIQTVLLNGDIVHERGRRSSPHMQRLGVA